MSPEKNARVLKTVSESVKDEDFNSTQQIYYLWRRSNDVGKYVIDGRIMIDVKELTEWVVNNGRQVSRTYFPRMRVDMVENRIAMLEASGRYDEAWGIRSIFGDWISDERIQRQRLLYIQAVKNLESDDVAVAAAKTVDFQMTQRGAGGTSDA